MPKIAKIGDTGSGYCSSHDRSVSVTFTTGSPSVNAEGIAVVRVGDKGIASCGHSTTATSGSPNVNANGIAVHRVGDAGVIDAGGSYTCVSGASTVSANG